MRLQRSDPILNMEVDVMRPAFNLEPKYRVTMFTREEWTRGPGTPPVVKGLLWFTDESRMMEGTGTGVYGQSLGRSLNISQGMKARVFRWRYMTSWPVSMNFIGMLGRKNMLIQAPIVRRL